MMSKIKPTLVLGIICLIVALLLSSVNSVTSPIIKAAQDAKVQETLVQVLPDGKNFVKLDDISDFPDIIDAIYTEDGGGYVFQLTVTGYKPGFVIMCGINADGVVTGAEYTISKETNGAENGLGAKYVGATNETVTAEIIGGSTKTSEAYYEAIKTALESFEILTGKEGAQ